MNLKKAKIISWIGRFIVAFTFILMFYKIAISWIFLVFLFGLALQVYAFIYRQNNE